MCGVISLVLVYVLKWSLPKNSMSLVWVVSNGKMQMHDILFFRARDFENVTDLPLSFSFHGTFAKCCSAFVENSWPN